MAKISTYVVHVPKAEDIIIGTQVYTESDPVLDNPTRNFTAESIANLSAISLTTDGSTGSATLIGTVLNIPNYSSLSQGSVANGVDGANGYNGDNGVDGIDGVDGADGSDGTDGSNGVDGTDGVDGIGLPSGGTEGQIIKMISGVAVWADCDCGSGSSGEGEGGNTGCTGHVFTNKQELEIAVNAWVVAGSAAATQTYGHISTWCTSQVTDMSYLFDGRTTFNEDISNWDVSNVSNMSYMFRDVTSFNQPIGNWDVRGVYNMNSMFHNASSFNQDIGAWDVSSVNNMAAMFQSATSFNNGGAPSIGDWVTGFITNMNYMFNLATSFNQDLSGWCVFHFTSEPDYFRPQSPLTTANTPNWGTCL